MSTGLNSLFEIGLFRRQRLMSKDLLIVEYLLSLTCSILLFAAEESTMGTQIFFIVGTIICLFLFGRNSAKPSGITLKPIGVSDIIHAILLVVILAIAIISSTLAAFRLLL